MRAQAALEYLVIVGMMLAILIPAFWYSLRTSQQTLDLRQTKDAAQKVARTADTVYALGPGSRMYARIRLPATVEDEQVGNNTVLFRVDVGQGPQDIFELTKGDVIGVLPEERGEHRVLVKMLESGIVQIGEAISLSPDPFEATIAPGAWNDSLFNLSSNVDYTVFSLSPSISGEIESWGVIGAADALVSSLSPYGWDLFDLNISVPPSQAAGTYDGTLLVSSNQSEATSAIQITVPSVLNYLFIDIYGYEMVGDIGFVVSGDHLSQDEREVLDWLESEESGEGYLWDYDIISDSPPSSLRNHSAVPQSWEATSGGSGYSEVVSSDDIYATATVAQYATENLTVHFPPLGLEKDPDSVNFTAEYRMSATAGSPSQGESQVDSMDDVSDWSEEYGATNGDFTTDSGTKQEGTASMEISYDFPAPGPSSSEELTDGGSISGPSSGRITGGDHTDTHSTTDGDYYYLGYEVNGNWRRRNGWMELEYDISSLGIDPSDLTDITLDADFCHSGDETSPACGQGDAMEGFLWGSQLVQVYDHANSEWDSLGSLSVNTGSDAEQSGSWSASSPLSNYVSGSDTVDVRFEVDFYLAWTYDAVLLLDYVPLSLTWSGGSETLDEYVIKKSFSQEDWTGSQNLSVWVYGDANGEDITLNITDSGGGSYEWTPLDVNWSGWQWKKFDLSGTSGVDLSSVNGVKIKLEETAAGDNPSGTLYLDDLRRFYTAGGGNFFCDLLCHDGSSWTEVAPGLAQTSDTTQLWDVTACLSTKEEANDADLKFSCYNEISSGQTFYLDYSRLDASYLGLASGDAESWNTSTGDSGSSEIQSSNDVYADEEITPEGTEKLEIDFPDLGVTGAPFSVNTTVEYRYSDVAEGGREGGSDVVDYLNLFPSDNPVNVQLNQPFNLTVTLWDQQGDPVSGKESYFSVNSIKDDNGAAAAFSTQPALESEPGKYAIEITMTSGNDGATYYVNGEYLEGSVPDRYQMWWHGTVNLNESAKTGVAWVFLPETDFVTLPSTGGTINLKLYCIDQTSSPLNSLSTTDFKISNVKSETGSAVGGWSQGTVTFEGDGIYKIPITFSSLPEGENLFLRGNWKELNKEIDFGASFFVNSSDPYAPAPDNPYVPGSPAAGLECELECRGEGGWSSLGPLPQNDSDTLATFSLDSCVSTQAIANDIHTRFNCTNHFSDNATLYVDYANVSVGYVGEESWNELNETDLCGYGAIMVGEHESSLDAALLDFLDDCGCVMLVGEAAASAPVSLGYANSSFSGLNSTLYVVDDSNYVTANYSNSSLVSVYSQSDMMWGSDADGVLATAEGNTLGEDGRLMYYGVRTQHLSSDGNNTLTRFVDRCLSKSVTPGTLEEKSDFRKNEVIVYRISLRDQGLSPADSSDVDSWVWMANGTLAYQRLDASTSGGALQESYTIPSSGPSGTWTVNATAAGPYSSVQNSTTFEVA